MRILAHQILVYTSPSIFPVSLRILQNPAASSNLHIAFYAVVLERCLDRTDALGRRVDRNFSPVHQVSTCLSYQITAAPRGIQ